MPGYKCPIKERMMYSSSKAPLQGLITQQLLIPITKNVSTPQTSLAQLIQRWGRGVHQQHFNFLVQLILMILVGCISNFFLPSSVNLNGGRVYSLKGQMHHHDDLGSKCAYTCHLSNKTTRKSVLLSTPQIWLMKVSKILA